MTGRLKQVEELLGGMAVRLEEADRHFAARSRELAEGLADIRKTLGEMAARQRYHDEAHERHDAEIKVLRDLVESNAETAKALLEIAGHH